MKYSALRNILCKFLIAVLLLLGLMVFSAVAEGALPLLAGLLLGLAGLVLLNLLCGLLLPREEPRPRRVPAAKQAVPASRPVPLRVVRGGRAA